MPPELATPFDVVPGGDTAEAPDTFVDPLGRTLYQLLYDAPTRERFLAGQPITSDAEQARALQCIDRDELRDAGERIRRDQLRGSGDLAGGLGTAYGRTLAAVDAAGHRAADLAQAYLRSPEFAGYRELPAAGPGLCAEEAFYRYMVRTGARWGCDDGPVQAVLRHEHLVALLQALTVNVDPSFTIAEPALAQRGRVRWVVEPYEAEQAAAIQPRWDRGAPIEVLYAASARGFMCGPVPPAVVEVLRAGSLRAIAAEYAAQGAPSPAIPEAIEAAAQRLVGLGLLEASA